jgi:hypothetical protein
MRARPPLPRAAHRFLPASLNFALPIRSRHGDLDGFMQGVSRLRPESTNSAWVFIPAIYLWVSGAVRSTHSDIQLLVRSGERPADAP